MHVYFSRVRKMDSIQWLFEWIIGLPWREKSILDCYLCLKFRVNFSNLPLCLLSTTIIWLYCLLISMYFYEHFFVFISCEEPVMYSNYCLSTCSLVVCLHPYFLHSPAGYICSRMPCVSGSLVWLLGCPQTCPDRGRVGRLWCRLFCWMVNLDIFCCFDSWGILFLPLLILDYF